MATTIDPARVHEHHAIEVIRQHIPSLSEQDERDINEAAWDGDAADLALRTCACGVRIDGFYAYVDHLIAVFGGESHIGD